MDSAPQIEETMPPPPYSEVVQTPLLKARRPSIHLRDVVEAYMASKRSGLDGSIHKALNTNDPRVKLDPDRHKWRETETEEINLESLYKDVEGDEKNFLTAMEYYDANAEPKYKVHINMKETHSMKDVMKAIDDARMKYDEKERKGFFGPIRRAFRYLGDNQDICTAWLDLLPGESEYFSIICGGLKMIFGAAGRVRKINEEIVSVLVQIPTILSKNRRVLAINKVSPELGKYSSALYVAVLHAMGHILKYYQEKAIPKAIGAFIQQGSFQRTLLEKIGAITQCSNAIDDEAELCGMELSKETNQVAKKTKQIAEGVYEKAGAIQEQTGEISQKADHIQDSVEDLREHAEHASQKADELLEVTRKQSEMISKQNEQIKLQCEAINNIQSWFMKDLERKDIGDAKDNTTPENTPQKRNATPTPDPSVARKLLLSRLSYEKEIPRADLRANLRYAMSLSLEDQDLAVYMMQSRPLQNWLQATNSSVLLVNGGAYSSGQRSPLSFVCAKLSNALRQARKHGSATLESMIIDLHFFCGEHVNWRDSLDNGPAGVLNSLLAQLLTRYTHFDVSLIKHLKKLVSDDTKALANVFGKLLAQLPSKMMVFCIIDGLSFYDDEERMEDCEQLLRKLISLTRRRESDGSCIFKLLLTAPTELRLNAVDKLDEEEEILRIPEGLEKGGGFTDMKWEMGAGQDIADLSELSIDA